MQMKDVQAPFTRPRMIDVRELCERNMADAELFLMTLGGKPATPEYVKSIFGVSGLTPEQAEKLTCDVRRYMANPRHY
ncbi:MAG: hypothetical protein COT89_01020 [Candidatus Colwellbacteria bacterium CG10_big_fil_rev_8_21_14_0_10_42_22]|uniref:Uncharacterized protein n=1 Tax=Candidatus Colwellbacteria bacterium CG10_big_fil_rev_8_21_14_0_10_42_22 TaxID=1974540 RepID=A0A2H0VIJ0_9BACT|nr:MAG: hypothetical protein COT89_01020 [Candidatus Colwellbacteria bacterium CG10_big_fil_rev_8_21_14_0_10_42_22]